MKRETTYLATAPSSISLRECSRANPGQPISQSPYPLCLKLKRTHRRRSQGLTINFSLKNKSPCYP